MRGEYDGRQAVERSKMERAAGWPPLAVFHKGYITIAVLPESSAKELG